MDYFAARQNMVESQVRVNDVTDAALQKAMRHIERERLVAPGQGFAAYGEVEASVAPGRALMKARDIAKLLHAVKPAAGQSVLAIAAPYAAAVLKHAGLDVTAQEADARVQTVVEPYLTSLGVSVVNADLKTAAEGQYDIIIVEGAVAEVPEAWLAALKPGGRLGVVVRTDAVGHAKVFTRLSHGVSEAHSFDSNPSLLPGFGKTSSFVF
ncbi:protein-L-isoaspartate O-methyltransferase [Asticcacaulis sp. BYS171W]|uniref:Protein-L-isoaspartate O-methyltransferase n=1 Tax=Asticcacaulis aquaticus TaxID=2984212 RepID=A0ABT5HWG0_9CAUL|nr:protein-L-isoaspartate O-methyltransferase [Asticcacaulis aquaticus]MDC7684309.1 protein-L-isoaspartate O-methyltransferase [Asticcacaulis aquaticus]